MMDKVEIEIIRVLRIALRVTDRLNILIKFLVSMVHHVKAAERHPVEVIVILIC